MSEERLSVSIDNVDEYISSLENLLIFMCKDFRKTWESIQKLEQAGNGVSYKISQIKINKILKGINLLSQMDYKESKYSFTDVYDKIWEEGFRELCAVYNEGQKKEEEKKENKMQEDKMYKLIIWYNQNPIIYEMEGSLPKAKMKKATEVEEGVFNFGDENNFYSYSKKKLQEYAIMMIKSYMFDIKEQQEILDLRMKQFEDKIKAVVSDMAEEDTKELKNALDKLESVSEEEEKEILDVLTNIDEELLEILE